MSYQTFDILVTSYSSHPFCMMSSKDCANKMFFKMSRLDLFRLYYNGGKDNHSLGQDSSFVLSSVSSACKLLCFAFLAGMEKNFLDSSVAVYYVLEAITICSRRVSQHFQFGFLID